MRCGGRTNSDISCGVRMSCAASPAPIALKERPDRLCDDFLRRRRQGLDSLLNDLL